MSNVPSHWIPHRREDGETLGWIDMDSCAPALVPIDRLGRLLQPVEDWLDAEKQLEDVGLRFLTETYLYQGQRVRIRNLEFAEVTLTTAQTDAVGDVGTEFRIPFPPGDALMPAEKS